MPKRSAAATDRSSRPADRLVAALSAIAGHHDVDDDLTQIFPPSHPTGARSLDVFEALALLADAVVSLQAEVSDLRPAGWRRRQRWRRRLVTAACAALGSGLAYLMVAPQLEPLLAALAGG